MSKVKFSVVIFGEKFEHSVYVKNEKQKEMLERAKQSIESLEKKINHKYPNIPRSKKVNILVLYLAFNNALLMHKVNELEEKLESYIKVIDLVENMEEDSNAD